MPARANDRASTVAILTSKLGWRYLAVLFGGLLTMASAPTTELTLDKAMLQDVVKKKW
jgi:hypothetical protein